MNFHYLNFSSQKRESTNEMMFSVFNDQLQKIKTNLEFNASNTLKKVG